MKTAISGREKSIVKKGNKKKEILCDSDSLSGSVSQRACVYCGARVVLNPITDALHIVHGPIGCASYTWDIRGSLSSGDELYRNSFSTDLKEKDVIFGGGKKLSLAIDELVQIYNPALIFIYATCIVGVIGDDLQAIAKAAEKKHGIKVIPVESSGFIGNKSAGYRAACDSLLKLIAPEKPLETIPGSINLLGDFNLAGETWIVRKYIEAIGLHFHTAFTGDSSSETLKTATGASLNLVQCAGSMVYLANKMEEIYKIPFIRISFLGIEDTIGSLQTIASWSGDQLIQEKTDQLITDQLDGIEKEMKQYRTMFTGKKAAVYVGGGFKAISLIKQFRDLGIEVVMIGTQTGSKDDYRQIESLVGEGTVVVDDTNPAELERFIKQKGADLLVGGVKERPLAYKLGIAFIDHNHDRKHPLVGFEGAINFAKEVSWTLNSPVWEFV